MNARLSDVHGELTDKQKRALEKSDTTIRDQTKELNATRLKLSKLSDIVDKQAAKIESLQSELSSVLRSFVSHFERIVSFVANRKSLPISTSCWSISDRQTSSD